MAFTKATYVSPVREYEFVVHPRDMETMAFVATCDLPNGGVTTCADTYGELFESMIPDAVATFEME